MRSVPGEGATPSRLLARPGIDDAHAASDEVADVARRDRNAIGARRSGDHGVLNLDWPPGFLASGTNRPVTICCSGIKRKDSRGKASKQN